MTQTNALQSLQQQWQIRWAAMAARERQLATVAAWLAGLTLLVWLGVRPAMRTLAAAPAQLQEVNAQLDQMHRLADEAQALRAKPPVPPAQAEVALRASTERLGKGAQLTMQGDRVTVMLNHVSGAALATWLDEVRASARVKPMEAALTQAELGSYSGSVSLALAPGVNGR